MLFLTPRRVELFDRFENLGLKFVQFAYDIVLANQQLVDEIFVVRFYTLRHGAVPIETFAWAIGRNRRARPRELPVQHLRKMGNLSGCQRPWPKSADADPF